MIFFISDNCHARTCISSHDELELPLIKSATVRCHSDFQACFTRWSSVNGSDIISEQGKFNENQSS
jgi:hypothetical protein